MINRWVSVVLVSLVFVFPAHAAVGENATKPSTKPIAKPARTAGKPPIMVPVYEAPAPAVLSAEQLAIAERVQVGTSRCELAVVVTVRADAHTAGRFVLDAGHKRYSLDPVVTSTGAVRLEDMTSGAVWIQLANKSMLMNQKLGQRIADECMNRDDIRSDYLTLFIAGYDDSNRRVHGESSRKKHATSIACLSHYFRFCY